MSNRTVRTVLVHTTQYITVPVLLWLSKFRTYMHYCDWILSFKIIFNFLYRYSLWLFIFLASFAISMITLYVLDTSILCEAKTGGVMLPACFFVLSLRNKFDKHKIFNCLDLLHALFNRVMLCWCLCVIAYVDARAMPKDVVRSGALVLKVNLFYMN